MNACPRCGGIHTLENQDGKAAACLTCKWTRSPGLDRWLPPGPPSPRLSPHSVFAALPLLPSLLRTTPGAEEGRAEPIRPPWTRDPAERGGPRTGGPTNPPGPQPLPAGIPRRRKPFGPGPAVALALGLVLALLPVSSAAPLPLHPGSSSDGPIFQVSLSFHNSSSNSTAPVSQAVADLLFINDTDLEPVENFTLSNGANYTCSNFTGMNLTNVTSVLVVGHPLTGFPRATPAQTEIDNLSSQSTVALDLVWTSSSYPSPPPPTTNGSFSPPPPAFPLFLQLLGVGLFLAFASLLVAGLWKIVSTDREGDPP